jgi:hypothetical protein
MLCDLMLCLPSPARQISILLLSEIAAHKHLSLKWLVVLERSAGVYQPLVSKSTRHKKIRQFLVGQQK